MGHLVAPTCLQLRLHPVVHEIDAWWDMKKHGYQRPLTGFQPIHMPANTGAGVVISGLSLVFGFALIWHMWLLAGASFAAAVAGFHHPHVQLQA